MKGHNVPIPVLFWRFLALMLRFLPKRSHNAGTVAARSAIMMFQCLERWLSGRKRQIANLLYES